MELNHARLTSNRVQANRVRGARLHDRLGARRVVGGYSQALNNVVACAHTCRVTDTAIIHSLLDVQCLKNSLLRLGVPVLVAAINVFTLRSFLAVWDQSLAVTFVTTWDHTTGNVNMCFETEDPQPPQSQCPR
eukprot:4816006-Amphidinium_carterae.1